MLAAGFVILWVWFLHFLTNGTFKTEDLYTHPPVDITKSEVDNCKSADCVRKILLKFNRSCTWQDHLESTADWNWAVDMTDANDIKARKVSVAFSEWNDKMVKLFLLLKKKDIPHLTQEEKRIIKFHTTTASTFNISIIRKLAKIQNKLGSTYTKARVVHNGKELGENELTTFFEKEKRCSVLTDVWKKWRDASGKKMRSDYQEMVELLNLGAKYNNYSDYGYYEWFTDFEQPDFTSKVMTLYGKLAQYYKEFHAYARFKLKQRYPSCVDAKGPIPAQLLGNPWGQEFKIADILKPYPNVHSANVTAALRENKWTVLKMYEASENFFSSMGMFNMTKKFWKYSLLKKPNSSRIVDCHGSAHDMGNYDDFRIKMCTARTGADFKTVFHEMGHIIYYMAYQNQPCTFRKGANSGFHEAVGDAVALSATSNAHLKELKLLKNFKPSKEADINTLMQRVTDTIGFIPFALVIDVWRWRVLNGTINPKDYNKEWWKLRRDLQGIDAPVPRTEDDFDPGSKYHVPYNVPYIRYFVSRIMQFQFYEALCKASGYKSTDPLFKCNFYNSKEAGTLFKSMLSLGASKPWPEAMKRITGQTEMKVDSIIKYFEPLFTWLKGYRKTNKYPIGW